MGVATVAGLVMAVYYGRREGRRQKLLAYQTSLAPFPVASSRSLEAYNLTLLYEPRGDKPREIESAYAHYVRFVNFGREPIVRSDIAPANPLRIQVKGSELLDSTLEVTTRDVSQIDLASPETDEETTSLRVSFDFLDYHDGAVVRLLTTSRPESVELVGDVIGMPEGVRTVSAMSGRRKLWGTVGLTLAGLFWIACLTLTVLVYRWVLRSWDSVWLVALPLIALVGPPLVAGIASDTIWPKGTPSFPPELLPRGLRRFPEWPGEFVYLTGPDGRREIYSQEALWPPTADPPSTGIGT